MSRRFARNGWPRGTQMITAGTVTASATPHTKGPWVDLVASMSRDICGFHMASTIAVFTASTDTSMLMDVGVGSTGDAVDQIKINNIPWGGLTAEIPVFFPLHVRKGERLAARIQGVVASDTFIPRLSLAFADKMPGWGGFSEADTYTANTATSGPTTGDLADNAWDEAVASTTNPIRGLTFHGCHVPGTSSTSAEIATVDVGVGAAAAEVALGTWAYIVGASESASQWGPMFIETEIPVGSRLAIRKNGTQNFSGLVIGWR